MKSSLSLTTQFIFLVLFHWQYFHSSSSSLSLSSNSSFSSSAVLCPYEQRHALLQFKSSFSINSSASYSDPENGYPPAYSKTESWKEGTDCCLWEGVTCDLETGYVISLNLSSSMLYGTFHSNDSLFSLSHLQKVNLSNNAFIGKVPSEISHLSNLVSLDLSYNYLSIDTTGFNKIVQNLTKLSELILNEVDMSMVAPTSFRNLSSLSSLKLAYCWLPKEFLEHVNLPSGLVSLDLSNNYDLRLDTSAFVNLVQNLSKLKELDLSFVNLSSVAPISFMNMTSSLSSLNLSYCDLQGKLRNNFHLPELVSLDLSGNDNLTIEKMAFDNLREVDLSYVNMYLVSPNSLMNLSSSLSFLRLYNCGLRGEFPDILFQRPNLQVLDLSGNDELDGIFSGSNGNSSLQYLDLSSTKIAILLESDFLSNLRSLKVLYLRGCNFTGSNPALFGNLTQLTHLELSSNNIDGEIPPSFTNLKQLSYLLLYQNNLGGPLPTYFSNFTQLIYLDLSNNNFNGEIPPSFGNLQQLTWLDLSNNNFNCEIPPSFGNLQQLTWLDLSNNNFNGEIPSSFGNLQQVAYLDLSSNNFSDEIPSSITNLQQLSSLDLSNNNLSGPLPTYFSNFTQLLSYIDLSSNKLHGPIPSSIFKFVDLNVLILSSNDNLTGHVPTSICKLQSLEILDLSNNSLSGVIPKCLGKFSNSLEVLHLGMNYFNGTIPTTFSKGNSLRYINFYGNQLQGQVPSSIINCRNLEFLDLSNNEIDDTFPFFLGALSELQVLVLRFNKFHGFVNNFSLNSPFPNLRIFDLSNNKLSGPLPMKYFDQFKAMMSSDQDMTYMGNKGGYSYDYSVELTFKGLEIELVKIQSLLTTIDFSCNNFTGTIPKSIGKLKSLKLLNMSHNRITGNILSSLRNLTNLESLDLSSNLLTGRIPDELAKITFLQVFNVSYNLLEGPIPSGNQFNTFDVSSYEGNSGLCGFPLQKECNNGESQQLIPPDEEYSKSENGFGWEAVLIGYGCGVLFGLTIGYVVFKTRKYSWFARMVEVEGYVWRKKIDKIKNSRKPHRRRN